MKIYSVYDPEFAEYGQVIDGMDDVAAEIINVLKDAPCPEGVEYVPEYAPMQALPAQQIVSDNLYGGMPVQLGWCNGHNTKLNCLEYHKDSEYNLGVSDFILLVAKQGQIENGVLDTSKVVAFKAPAGAIVECYATTLHYAPCSAKLGDGFQVMVALPKNTNTEMPKIAVRSFEDKRLWARNKWLLAHKDTSEAAAGAYVGLVGENIDIAAYI
jgi:hypothetical protein